MAFSLKKPRIMNNSIYISICIRFRELMSKIFKNLSHSLVSFVVKKSNSNYSKYKQNNN